MTASTGARESARRERAQRWAALLAEFEGSGLTGRAFCQARGVSYRQFLYWRSERCSSADGDRVESVSAAPASALGFVRITPGLGGSSVAVSVEAHGVGLARLAELLAVLAR